MLHWFDAKRLYRNDLASFVDVNYLLQRLSYTFLMAAAYENS
jgi:hypothetical protein